MVRTKEKQGRKSHAPVARKPVHHDEPIQQNRIKEVVIDPNDVLTQTQEFVIMRDGRAISKSSAEVKLTPQKCKDCDHVRTGEHDTFIDGRCNACHILSLPKLDVPTPKMDTAILEGSSMFSSADYEHPATDAMENGKLILHVKRDKSKLVYLNVPHKVWLEFISAKSVGKFYNERIKGQFLPQQGPTGG